VTNKLEQRKQAEQKRREKTQKNVINELKEQIMVGG
jgi:hypothetical protein